MASGKSLKSGIAAMLKEDSTGDIVIKCEDQELRAHKFILCARSPVFKAMFQSDMVVEIQNEVNVEETSMIVVKQMVNSPIFSCGNSLYWNLPFQILISHFVPRSSAHATCCVLVLWCHLRLMSSCLEGFPL